jgi:cytochrome P450
MAVSLGILVVLTAIVLFVVYSYINSGPKLPKGTHYPPGSPQKPIVGNLLDLPSRFPWFKYQEWKDTYGPIFRLKLGGGEHYFVSTQKMAEELLRERGNIHSSREAPVAASNLLSDGLRMLFWPHAEKWRSARKFMHVVCKESASQGYQPAQELESSRMLYDLTKKPAEYDQWFERYASGLIFRVGFGKVMEAHDSIGKAIFKIVHNVERVAMPGTYLVDTFPILQYLPRWLAPFKRELQDFHKEELKVF